MAQINPALPSTGGDAGQWGDELNTALGQIIGQGNASDTAIAGKVDKPSTGTASSTTFLRGDGTWAAPDSVTIPTASTTVAGVVQLAGDLAGTSTSPALKAVGTAGTYGSSTAVPVITTDSKGRVTAVTTAPAAGFYFYDPNNGWPAYPSTVPVVLYSVGYPAAPVPSNAADNSIWFYSS